MAPPDPILGLSEAFKKDPNPAKIDLGVGVYKDEEGNTPILDTVKRTEERLLKEETTKDYLGMAGNAEYGAAIQELVLGADHEVAKGNRAVTAHTPGGTAALRVAGDFIHKWFPQSRIWLSDPTWANHTSVFRAAGLEVRTYSYYDTGRKRLDFNAMMTALDEVPEGDVVLLHGSCHNPTGVDPSLDQWRQIADLAAKRKWVPFVDFAYQGLADGIEEDAAGLRTLCRPGSELLFASSFSKNFGLYRERVGALTVVASSHEAAQKAFSHVKLAIRANYSNPPAHGALIVTTILNDPELRAKWETEVQVMRNRINGMRKLFVETLKAKGVEQDFSFITRQKGMFSFSGLNKDHVETLRRKYSIYIVGTGRINVAGMTTTNIDALCQAIAEVLRA